MHKLNATEINTAEVKQLIGDWRRWGVAEEPVILEELTGGLTNRNFLLQSGSDKLVLRVNHPHGQALGADRSRENQVHDAIAHLGVIPTIRFTDPEQRYLLRDYIEGQPLTQGALTIDDLNRIKDILDRVHACNPGIFSNTSELQVADSCTAYLSMATMPDQRAKAALMKRINAIQPLPTHESTLCHLDPLPANWLKDHHGKLWLIDWEYACRAHPLLDFAALFHHLPEHLKEHWEHLHDQEPAALRQEALRQVALLEESWYFAQR